MDTQGRKHLKSINEAREYCGMDKLSITIKKCLRCNRKFESTGKFIRLCDSCKTQNKTVDDITEQHFRGRNKRHRSMSTSVFA